MTKKNKIPKPNKDQQRFFYNGIAMVKLTFIFASIISLAFFFISFILWLVVIKTNLLSLVNSDRIYKPAIVIAIVFIALVVGYAVAFAVGQFLISPIRNINKCFDKFAKGNFKTRLDLKGPFSKYIAFEEFSKSFNNMADELEHTEMLSNDFINNFSHEFKTPIVSIAGFAKLLKKDGISDDQKKEYVNIIEEESLRLSQMTTNILSLIKIENQQILSSTTQFNLSEQIRNCLLLLENKWQHKNLDFQIDFDEFDIWANEELLKQVWINLLDNAIKFSPNNGILKINIEKTKKTITIEIANSGSFIPIESRDRIFNKFYQGDESHFSEGNGIGLAVVKKIINLHKGKITVDCQNDFTSFYVTLPL